MPTRAKEILALKGEDVNMAEDDNESEEEVK
jgi:hypothetical protein